MHAVSLTNYNFNKMIILIFIPTIIQLYNVVGVIILTILVANCKL